MEEGWGEPCNGSVETFVGSDIHLDAFDNSREINVIKRVDRIHKEYHFVCPECDSRIILSDEAKPLQEIECSRCGKPLKLPDFYRY